MGFILFNDPSSLQNFRLGASPGSSAKALVKSAEAERENNSAKADENPCHVRLLKMKGSYLINIDNGRIYTALQSECQDTPLVLALILLI